MTDRVQALTVVLARDIRTDDVEPLIQAIERLRGVFSVAESHVVGPKDYYARERIRAEIQETLVGAVRMACEGKLQMTFDGEILRSPNPQAGSK